MPAVLIEDVSRHFGDVVAVNHVNLSIERGEFVTLLGPSGCGKTTTLRMVAGLEQNTAGRISIGDRVVSDAAAGFFVPPDHRQLGMVFQSYAIWPHMTVFDNVAYPLRIRRRPKAEINDRVHSVLRLVEMESFADRPAPALSGGQQQRVAIARALVFEPQVLLLDEPLSNLDARLRTQMGDEFRALQKRLGITSLYVTHDQEEAMAISDRIAVMDKGVVAQEGTAEDLYYRPASEFVARFIGRANLLEARVTSAQDVDVNGLRLMLTSGKPVGTTVTLVVRPEMISLRADAAGAARILQRTFLGEKTDYQVAFGDTVLQVAASGKGRLAPDDAVSFQFDIDGVHVLS
jgi:iron(III) transport system ATP-binding protein